MEVSMIKILICSEDMSLIDEFSNWLSFLTILEIQHLTHPRILIECPENIKTDILIISTDFKKHDGIELAGNVQAIYPDIQIIFTSACPFLNPRIYDVMHRCFLTSPFSKNCLLKAVLKCIDVLFTQRNRSLIIKSSQYTYLIPFKDITYIESDKRTIQVHMDKRRPPVRGYYKLDDIMKQLDNSFVQCHKSFIVNMKYIFTFTRKEFIMQDGNKIPISQLRVSSTKEIFLHYVQYLDN